MPVIVRRLRVSGMRRLQDVDLSPGPGLNLITGDNGAGKTTLLEALHLMAHGRSFRGRVRDGLVCEGRDALEIVLDWEDGANQPPRRAGLRHGGSQWEARLDGAPVRQLGDLCAALAVTTFEPDSHALVSGGAESRRRFLDWGMFHVEPGFLDLWRRYQRALRQRNALLKQQAASGQLDAWELELSSAGEALTHQRREHLVALQPCLDASLARLLPEAGGGQLELSAGWREEAMPLADALYLARARDLASGHTSVGPHRADLRIVLAQLPERTLLSRGQAKALALALLLGQAEQVRAASGRMPAVALDDLASELDRAHQALVLDWLAATGAQAFITGTEVPAVLCETGAETRRFHVEHGAVAQR